MLKFFGVEPVIVFDGDRLPAKASEEGTRRQEKRRNRKDESDWNKAIEKARRLCLRRA